MRKGGKKCAVEWPVKNDFVISGRDRNTSKVGEAFAYQREVDVSVKYEFIVCGHDSSSAFIVSIPLNKFPFPLKAILMNSSLNFPSHFPLQSRNYKF